MDIIDHIKNLGKNHWDWNLYSFCKALGFDPNTDHGRARWADFQELNRLLGRFDAERLRTIFGRAEDAKTI